MRDGFFGFDLEEGEGFRVGNSILPFLEGYLDPFSLSLRLLFNESPAGKSLFRVLDNLGEQYFHLGFDDAGDLVLEVEGSRSFLSGDAFLVGQETSITISFVPDLEEIRILWYVSGILLNDDTQAYSPVERSSLGQSFIAGENGFNGIIDELGIYHVREEERIEVDDEVYARAMAQKYGGDFVYAEGFDGLYPPENLVYEGNVEEVRVDGSKLTLPPGASVTMPPIPFASESLVFEFDGENPEPQFVDIRFFDDLTGTHLFTYSLTGALNLAEGGSVEGIQGLPLRLDLIKLIEGGLELYWSDGFSTISETDLEISDLTIQIENLSGNADVNILGILVTKNREPGSEEDSTPLLAVE